LPVPPPVPDRANRVGKITFASFVVNAVQLILTNVNRDQLTQNSSKKKPQQEVTLTNPDPLVNLFSATPYIGLQPDSLRTILCRGTYPELNAAVVKIGRRIFFRQSDLEKFIASRSVGALQQSLEKRVQELNQKKDKQ
jgi:hypothetical protein